MSPSVPRARGFVRAVGAMASLPNPSVQLAIAVDTAYVAGNGGGHVSTGLYVVDNELNDGSKGEGSISLWTRCPVGSLIGYRAYPIDTTSGDQASVTGFSVVTGDVFGAPGYPIEIQPGYWIAQAMFIGSQSYQIQLCITAGILRPTKFYVSALCQISAH